MSRGNLGMPLEVIGAGWGRTGTLSLKFALEKLGYPTHHMFEVFQHPEHSAVFTAAARGEPVDWETVFGDYRAMVDWPGCAFWRDLMRVYPDAKVLLSVRDPEKWFESYRATIYQGVKGGIPGADDWNEMVRAVIVERSMEGNGTAAGLVDIPCVGLPPRERMDAMPKKYPPEFKRDVARVARRGDMTVAEVAADFDVSVESVRRWKRQAEIDDGIVDGRTTAEQSEVVQLRRDKRRLEMENEILRRATAYFAKDAAPLRSSGR